VWAHSTDKLLADTPKYTASYLTLNMLLGIFWSLFSDLYRETESEKYWCWNFDMSKLVEFYLGKGNAWGRILFKVRA
jgi:hypothetical protein